MRFVEWSQSPRTAVNFGLILIAFVINGVVVHRNSIALHQANSQVIHTHEVLSLTEQIYVQQVNAESSARGYGLTGDLAYLQVFEEARTVLPNACETLRTRVKDNASQLALAKELQLRSESQIEHLQLMIDAREESGIDGVRTLVAQGVGKRMMDETRTIVQKLATDENQLLLIRSNFAARQLYTILFANLCLVGIGLLISGVSWKLLDSHIEKCIAAETQAEAERENLMVTLASIGDAVIVTDACGRIQMANPVAQQLMGQSEPVTGRLLDEVFSLRYESSMTAVPSPVNEVLRLGNVVKPTRQTLLFRPDETQVPIEVNAAPIRSKETHVAGAVLVFRNVTDRRQFEKQLQEREQHLRRMLQTPLIGIAVCESDGRRLLEANETFLNLIGSTTGSWAGSTLSWDGITTTRGPLDDAAQKEIAESGLCRPFEKSCRRADGKVVPVLISANKLSDEDDRIIVFVTDLSESKRSEASLKESENRFLILSESMPQIVWLARVNGDLNYVNQTFVNFAGRNKESLTEWGWIDLIHPDDRDAHVNAWKKSIMSAEPFEAEHRLQDHTGDYRWHLTRALPMYNDASEITQWIGTMTDIHDHKQVEAFLKEEHHRKDQFLAMLAHELRNPLAPLANVVEILTAAPHDPQVLNEVLPIMKRKVRLLTRLIDDLLDVARITQGRIVLKCQPVSVQSIVTNAVETAQQWITQSEHELTITVPPEELFINADKTRMVQVLMNLLQNAAKYTNPKGQLALTVTHTPCEVCFSVRDNGQGLSALMLTRIFDLFMHVEPTLDRTPGGLGIGLSVVRTLVELHGGTVAAKSEGLGRGSEFLVRMPLIDAEQKDAQNSNGAVDRNNRGLPEANRNAVSKSGSTTAPLPALRILVVDDVKASAKTLAMMLKALGQDVEMAFDGVSALARLQETDFDLAFLDIAMPGMDGLEVARQLRASNGAVSPEVTLVALTGFDQDDDRRRSLDAGFNQHLIKPTSLNLLRDVLQAVVDRKASAGKSAQA